MNKNERIVCEFLRKIAPSREWEYLGEVEHCWIGELCDELNKQLEAENAKLREELDAAKHDLSVFSGEIVASKAENARLRSELESVGTAAYLYGRGDLKAENAKLRELRADMRECALVDGCYACEYGFDGACGKRIAERQRELGVEIGHGDEG